MYSWSFKYLGANCIQIYENCIKSRKTSMNDKFGVMNIYNLCISTNGNSCKICKMHMSDFNSMIDAVIKVCA